MKENHKDLYEDIKLLFDDADKREFKGVDGAENQTQEKSAGRVEERSYQLLEKLFISGIQRFSYP